MDGLISSVLYLRKKIKELEEEYLYLRRVYSNVRALFNKDFSGFARETAVDDKSVWDLDIHQIPSIGRAVRVPWDFTIPAEPVWFQMLYKVVIQFRVDYWQGEEHGIGTGKLSRVLYRYWFTVYNYYTNNWLYPYINTYWWQPTDGWYAEHIQYVTYPPGERYEGGWDKTTIFGDFTSNHVSSALVDRYISLLPQQGQLDLSVIYTQQNSPITLEEWYNSNLPEVYYNTIGTIIYGNIQDYFNNR